MVLVLVGVGMALRLMLSCSGTAALVSEGGGVLGEAASRGAKREGEWLWVWWWWWWWWLTTAGLLSDGEAPSAGLLAKPMGKPPLPFAGGSGAPGAAAPPCHVARLLLLPSDVSPVGVEEARASGTCTAPPPLLPTPLPSPRTAALVFSLGLPRALPSAATAAAADGWGDGGRALADWRHVSRVPAPPSWDTRALLRGLLWALQGRGASANWQRKGEIKKWAGAGAGAGD